MNSLETQGKQPINNTEGRAQGGRENQQHMMGWKGEVSWDKKGICNIIWEQILLGKDCIRKAGEKNVDVIRMDQILCEKEEKVLYRQNQWNVDVKTEGGMDEQVEKQAESVWGAVSRQRLSTLILGIRRQREIRDGRRMRIIPGQLKESAEAK